MHFAKEWNLRLSESLLNFQHYDDSSEFRGVSRRLEMFPRSLKSFMRIWAFRESNSPTHCRLIFNQGKLYQIKPLPINYRSTIYSFLRARTIKCFAFCIYILIGSCLARQKVDKRSFKEIFLECFFRLKRNREQGKFKRRCSRKAKDKVKEICRSN